ncbi:MAG: uroporphyrinogen-III C-methyltransferase [Bacteroidetes bacterium]|nr:uroporphyrinogen-III C-methyltransferase [Bacteroidota bacterium]
MHKIVSFGKVILAGAGCGDPELITVKAARYLQEADLVITDRLVSKSILDTYVSSETPIIYVGKQCKQKGSTPQENINQLLVDYAADKKLIVRLKGGDTAFFSNILDELQTLISAGIRYEIIPGITAASGASSYAGIPLTARGYATSVRFLTSYNDKVVDEAYWKDLANTADTLVFYMSSNTIDLVVDKLKSYQISNDKKIAVVSQATTPQQQIFIGSFDNYDEELKGKTFLSPSLVIIGKVVALHESFNWFNSKNNDEYYFKPVEELVQNVLPKQAVC